jgi:hypothetical protein
MARMSMGTKSIKECKDFAMYFAANWEFFDSSWQGELYEHKTTKEVELIDEIFDKWNIEEYKNHLSNISA